MVMRLPFSHDYLPLCLPGYPTRCPVAGMALRPYPLGAVKVIVA
jgi:hypothetical protein